MNVYIAVAISGMILSVLYVALSVCREIHKIRRAAAAEVAADPLPVAETLRANF